MSNKIKKWKKFKMESCAASDSWLSKNVRPLVLVWCIVVFSFAGILDSVDSIPFNIGTTWNDTFEKVMMAVVLAYLVVEQQKKQVALSKVNNGKKGGCTHL